MTEKAAQLAGRRNNKKKKFHKKWKTWRPESIKKTEAMNFSLATGDWFLFFFET